MARFTKVNGRTLSFESWRWDHGDGWATAGKFGRKELVGGYRWGAVFAWPLVDGPYPQQSSWPSQWPPLHQFWTTSTVVQDTALPTTWLVQLSAVVTPGSATNWSAEGIDKFYGLDWNTMYGTNPDVYGPTVVVNFHLLRDWIQIADIDAVLKANADERNVVLTSGRGAGNASAPHRQVRPQRRPDPVRDRLDSGQQHRSAQRRLRLSVAVLRTRRGEPDSYADRHRCTPSLTSATSTPGTRMSRCT